MSKTKSALTLALKGQLQTIINCCSIFNKDFLPFLESEVIFQRNHKQFYIEGNLKPDYYCWSVFSI